MSSHRASILIAATLLLAGGAAQSETVLWFSDSAGKLGTVDLATGATTTVGTMAVAMTDIAFSPSGELYGTTPNSLWRIDPATASTTFLSSHSAGLNSLVFDTAGTLYGASSALYTFNPSTGVGTYIGAMGASSSGDLAFVGGKLYLSATQGGDSLQQLNTTTGAATFVGNIGRSSVFGLASPNGVDLYGMTGTSVFRIDPTTGAASANLVSFSGFGQTYGTTFYEEARPPIPEPSTYAMMLLGLVGLSVAARRRR